MQANIDKKILNIVLATTLLMIFVCSLIFIVSFYGRYSADVYIGGAQVKAKVADDDVERQKGLSGTNQLNQGDGMLFVFDYPADWPIWMKDMRYPIDIVWMDEDKKVVDVAVEVSPDSYPEQFVPKKAAKYVLELPSGFVKQYSVEVNTMAAFAY
ncbi:MAG: DUF192 domain-containing protein [Candidatus Woesebacteria bacterium]